MNFYGEDLDEEATKEWFCIEFPDESLVVSYNDPAQTQVYIGVKDNDYLSHSIALDNAKAMQVLLHLNNLLGRPLGYSAPSAD